MKNYMFSCIYYISNSLPNNLPQTSSRSNTLCLISTFDMLMDCFMQLFFNFSEPQQIKMVLITSSHAH